MKIAICDDEELYIETIKKYIEEYYREKSIKLEICTFSDGKQLIENYKKYDIVFLDIEMKIMDGLKTAEEIRKKDMHVPIVYITSYKEYWRKAYKVHAFSFILKPIDRKEIYDVLLDYDKLLKEKSRCLLHTTKGLITIEQDKILYFYILSKKKVQLVTLDETYIVQENLKDIFEKLNENVFFASHKCCIVNMTYIKKIENNYDIVMDNDEFLPLAHNKKSQFMEKLTLLYVKNVKKGKV